MLNFPSVQDMLENLVYQKVEENKESFVSHDGDLKMTTTWLINGGIEILFGYETLEIPFKNIHVIVDSYFFKVGFCSKYNHAYHELSKNVIWDSVDTLVAQEVPIEVNPISFISLISCFRRSSQKIDLADVLNHITYPSIDKRLTVVLSSKTNKSEKINEIDDAKSKILTKFENTEIQDFKILPKGGDYCGFTASF